MSLVVRTGPQEYECKVGVLNSLAERLKNRGVHKAIIVHGDRSWKKAQQYLSCLLDSNIALEFVPFNGECTYKEVDRIAEVLKTADAEAVIGVGGGKLLDAVKYTAAKVPRVQSILIPTLASNCAPWTPLSVMYTENGINLGFDTHTKQTDVLLVEPELLLEAPVNYFAAGVADTLAKWYESDVILSRPENQVKALLQTSRSAAYICKENIVQYGEQAVLDIQSQTVTTAFVQVAETIIAVSGLVGGLGDGYARTTIAHAVHDKLTAFQETHPFLHGEKVAYGILVQLAVEGKWTEVDQLLLLFETLRIPKSLHDLQLQVLTHQQIAQLANEIISVTGLVQSGYNVTAHEIQKAIENLESYVEAKV